MEKRGISGGGLTNNNNKGLAGLGKGFTGVVGHSVPSTSSLNPRRGGGFLLSNGNPAARPQGLPAVPQFFSAVPLKHTLPPQMTQSPVAGAGGGDPSSALKDEEIRALKAKIKMLESQMSGGGLSQQLSNMSEHLNEARRILKMKDDMLNALTKEKETLREVFLDLREEFRETQSRLEFLQEKAKAENNNSVKKSKKGRRTVRKDPEQLADKKAIDEAEAAVTASKIKLMEIKIADLEKDIMSYQEGFLENILGQSSSRNSGASSRNHQGDNKVKSVPLTPSSTDMHSFLRETIQKLKDEVNTLNEERQSLKSLSEGKSIECIRLEKELKDAQDDLKRLNSTINRLEEQNSNLTVERDSLRSHFQETIVPQLTSQVDSLKKSVESLERQLESSKKESIEMKERLERDVVIEREKADLLLAQGIEEREGAETKWRERWDEHTSRMKDEMIALRKEFEEPLRTAHVREERLRLALEDIEERYSRSKEAWESYRRDLFEQVNEWKNRFGQKVEIIESLKSGKIEMETLLQKKLEEITLCHEMVRRGLEERQELEKRLEDFEERARNNSSSTLQSSSSTTCYSSTDTSVLRMPLGVSEHDLEALQAKMVQDAHEIAAGSSSSSSSSNSISNHHPPPPPPPSSSVAPPFPPRPSQQQQPQSQHLYYQYNNPDIPHPYKLPPPPPSAPSPPPTASAPPSFSNNLKPKSKSSYSSLNAPRAPGAKNRRSPGMNAPPLQPPETIPGNMFIIDGSNTGNNRSKPKPNANAAARLRNPNNRSSPHPTPAPSMMTMANRSKPGGGAVSKAVRLNRTTRRHP